MNMARSSNEGRSTFFSFELNKLAMVEEPMLNPLRCHFQAVLVTTRTSLHAGFTIPYVLADGSYVDQIRPRSMLAELRGC